MEEKFLELDSVFFEHDEEVLLHDINLQFAKARTYLVTCEPDGGKSLLLKIAGGIICPTKGSVKLNGEELYDETKRNRLTKIIGSVFQESTLISNLSVEENILLPIKYLNPHYDKKEITLEILNLLRYFEIRTAVLKKRPANVSNSTKKLINIIRAIITKPVIYLIDDPLFNLDAVDRKKVAKKLLELKQNGETLIIASNDRSLIEILADEVILLQKGMLSEIADTDGFFHSDSPLTQDFISHHIGG